MRVIASFLKSGCWRTYNICNFETTDSDGDDIFWTRRTHRVLTLRIFWKLIIVVLIGNDKGVAQIHLLTKDFEKHTAHRYIVLSCSRFCEKGNGRMKKQIKV
jgi:hypothetical protein